MTREYYLGKYHALEMIKEKAQKRRKESYGIEGDKHTGIAKSGERTAYKRIMDYCEDKI